MAGAGTIGLGQVEVEDPCANVPVYGRVDVCLRALVGHCPDGQFAEFRPLLARRRRAWGTAIGRTGYARC